MAKKESPQDKLINLQAQQLAAQVANWAAQLEFQKERLRLLELPEMQGKAQIDIDRLAFDKGQAAWENAFKESTLTGTYQGQPTTEWLTQQAQLTGVLDGKQTLQGKLTDAQVAQMNAQMKLANDEFVTNATGYYNGQKTFDREKFEASQASDAWKFLATLTGPANALKQARAIGSMPGGMRDLMGAWAGQYALPGSTSVGSGGQAGLAGLLEGNTGEPGAPGGSGFVGALPGGQAPVAPPTAPAATGGITGSIPGRGFTQDQWNPATQAAVAAWNAAHPGYVADGSQLGYHIVQPQAPQQVVGPVPLPGFPGPSTPGAPTAPAPTPVAPGGAPTGVIPGRGFMPAQWNAATTAAVNAWNAAHPGYEADGSQVGYHAVEQMPTYTDTAAAAGSASPVANTVPYVYHPAGVQAPAGQWNYSANPDGSVATYPPGVQSPASTPDITSVQPLSPTAAGNLYQYGGTQVPAASPGVAETANPTVSAAVVDPLQAGAAGTGALLPNQINARNYANSFDYQKELGWASFEDQGWDKGLAQEAFQRSLPKYTGPKAGSFAF